jgi:hypothetical protein
MSAALECFQAEIRRLEELRLSEVRVRNLVFWYNGGALWGPP